MEKKEVPFQRLLRIMDELREQCPWDKKQTIQSLRQQTIEELYELAEAITEEDWEVICEESGDLLYHLVFYAKIASEKGKYDIADAIEHVCDKLVARHPHVYGEVKVKDEEEVKKNWQAMKLKEGRKSALGGIPKAMPALAKAIRIQQKAREVGFDWNHDHEVWEKVKEELAELHEAVIQKDRENIEEEIGDALFSIINYARFLNIDPENALEKTNKKFIKRFQFMEKAARKTDSLFNNLSLEEMDQLWNQAKKQFK